LRTRGLNVNRNSRRCDIDADADRDLGDGESRHCGQHACDENF
jgi:hypothetical protein